MPICRARKRSCGCASIEIYERLSSCLCELKLNRIKPCFNWRCSAWEACALQVSRCADHLNMLPRVHVPGRCLPMKTIMHQSVSMWLPYVLSQVSTCSFGVNLCVALQGHLWLPLIATTCFSLQLAKPVLFSYCSAGRNVQCNSCECRDCPIGLELNASA